LISSKFPQLENKNERITRIKKASEFIPLESLCLSRRCSLASTEEGNKLIFEDQWAKLKLIKEIYEGVINIEKLKVRTFLNISKGVLILFFKIKIQFFYLD